MDLIDRQTINNTVIRLNEEGWEITRYEHKRITNVLCEMPTVDAVPMSVIEEIKADIIEMRKRDPLYYYVSTEDILDWVLNTIDRKVKEHTS